MVSESLIGRVEDEFDEADFGDERLSSRLLVMAAALQRQPAASLALASQTAAAREASYRFVENSSVTLAAILEPHRQMTAERCGQEETVLVASDTTEFIFKGPSRGKALGRIQGKQRGFLGHVALAISGAADRKPLGVVGISIRTREEEKKKHRNVKEQKQDPNRESLRWGEMVESTEKLMEGVRPIHLMDAEADIYELLVSMQPQQRRFVIRSAQNRLLVDDTKLRESVGNSPVLLEREVQLSARAMPRGTSKGRGLAVRSPRLAKLAVSGTSVTVVRPKTCETALPESLTLNVVNVCEPRPPEGCEPVQWLLYTSEPVATTDDVVRVVDAYRSRWLIEEFFKVLKTGCDFEGRQLRSLHTLTNALGILAVIAWRLLLLRTIERTAPETPADEVLEPIVLEALAARLKHIGERKPFPVNATVADLMKGVARLGGHHKSNGPPGWQLLWRGFQDLATWTSGFIAGRTGTYRDHS